MRERPFFSSEASEKGRKERESFVLKWFSASSKPISNSKQAIDDQKARNCRPKHTAWNEERSGLRDRNCNKTEPVLNESILPFDKMECKKDILCSNNFHDKGLLSRRKRLFVTKQWILCKRIVIYFEIYLSSTYKCNFLGADNKQ